MSDQQIWLIFIVIIAIGQFIALSIFGFDKFKAKAGGSRVPEATLLVFTLLFGIGGSLAAMFGFRHKIKKASFMAKFIGVSVVRGFLVLAAAYVLFFVL